MLFNMGLALHKVGRHEESFKCFEKSSHLLKYNPKLWYYMGLSIMKINEVKL